MSENKNIEGRIKELEGALRFEQQEIQKMILAQNALQGQITQKHERIQRITGGIAELRLLLPKKEVKEIGKVSSPGNGGGGGRHRGNR